MGRNFRVDGELWATTVTSLYVSEVNLDQKGSKTLATNNAMSQKTPPSYILNILAKNDPILIIFGVRNHTKLSHKNINLTHLA